MENNDEIELDFTKKEEIEKIVAKIKDLNFEDLKKTKYYEISLLEKNTDEKELVRYFKEFDRIKLVRYRKRKNGYNNYDFYYVLDDGTYLIYAINIDKSPPELVNAFKAYKNFKRFMESVKGYYGKKVL